MHLTYVIDTQVGLCGPLGPSPGIGNCSMSGNCSPAPTPNSQWAQGPAHRTHAYGQVLQWGVRPALYLGCYETCFC